MYMLVVVAVTLFACVAPACFSSFLYTLSWALLWAFSPVTKNRPAYEEHAKLMQEHLVRVRNTVYVLSIKAVKSASDMRAPSYRAVSEFRDKFNELC